MPACFICHGSDVEAVRKKPLVNHLFVEDFQKKKVT